MDIDVICCAKCWQLQQDNEFLWWQVQQGCFSCVPVVSAFELSGEPLVVPAVGSHEVHADVVYKFAIEERDGQGAQIEELDSFCMKVGMVVGRLDMVAEDNCRLRVSLEDIKTEVLKGAENIHTQVIDALGRLHGHQCAVMFEELGVVQKSIVDSLSFSGVAIQARSDVGLDHFHSCHRRSSGSTDA